MAYQLSFAGTTLRLPDPDTVKGIELAHPFVDGTEEVWWHCQPGGRIAKLSAPYPPNRKVGLNEFWYPIGASQFSIFGCIAAYDDVAAMMLSVYGTTTTQGTFTIRSDGDSTDTGISTNLYMLPPRPVADVQAGPGVGLASMYWLTFVDERYWFSKTPAGIITCDSTTSTNTWTNLIAVLAASLGITLTLDAAIESVYGFPEPDSALYSNNENAAVMLDVVLANLGRYLVRNLNGTYLAVRSNAGIGYSKIDRASYTKRLGGGQIFVDALSDSDPNYLRGPLLPATFEVSFPQWYTSGGYVEPGTYRSFTKDSYGAVFTETISTGSLGSPYSGFATSDETVALRTTAKALVTVANGTPTNAASCLALAKQLATDWIDAQLQYLDETYRGIATINPRDGYDILWNYNAPSTRLLRTPFGWGTCEFQHGFGPVSSACDSITTTDVTNVCTSVTTSSGYVTSVTTVVEYTPRTWSIVNGCLVMTPGTPVCITDPSDCCAGYTSCSECPVVPAAWECTISGVANGTCVTHDCTSYNTNFVLNYEGSNGSCIWFNFGTFFCNSTIVNDPYLEWNGTTWKLAIGTYGVLTLVGSTFNCLGINTFTGTLTGGICTGTVTAVIVPA